MIHTLESRFPEAARSIRERVEQAIDHEFGASPRPFPMQLFCSPVGGGRDRFEVTVSAPGMKLAQELEEKTLLSRGAGWTAFSERTAARVVETLRRQTPGIVDKLPE